MLDFEPVTLDKKGMMERCFFAWGEGSCQHSFVSSFCLAGKYGDQVCERDGFLYILRSKLCGGGERVYLFPQGDTSDREAARRAIGEVLNDAHEYGATVRFETLTRPAKDLTLELFPGAFTATENRDYAEYVYSFDNLGNLSGPGLGRRRQWVHHFERIYKDRYQTLTIEARHIPIVREFQENWLQERLRLNDSIKDIIKFARQLQQENIAIQKELDHFFELGLSGVVLFLDGKIVAYAIGAPLSGNCFDILVGKGDRSIPNIYCVLIRDFAQFCCQGYSWINLEEDVGIEGIRAMKIHYRPDFMIEKFIVREKCGHE